LKDKHIEVLHDYVNAEECFPNVEIKGGICYFLWNRYYDDDCNVISHAYGVTEKCKRPLLLRGEDIFVRYNKGISIIDKVKALNEKSFSSIVSPQNPFGFNTAVKGTSKLCKDSVVILSKGMIENYIERDKVKLHQEWINTYKILTPKAAESGGLKNRIIGKCYLVDPGKCCNGTYILIGPFENKETASIIIKYLNTKFCRFLIAMKKNTQDLKDQTFSIVPMQDFTSNSDIDWNKTIHEIDRELYKKYDLSEDEINFIESMIKPIE
jgi:site-specific DNA-methyltransferase (adenine-specific)